MKSTPIPNWYIPPKARGSASCCPPISHAWPATSALDAALNRLYLDPLGQWLDAFITSNAAHQDIKQLNRAGMSTASRTTIRRYRHPQSLEAWHKDRSRKQQVGWPWPITENSLPVKLGLP